MWEVHTAAFNFYYIHLLQGQSLGCSSWLFLPPKSPRRWLTIMQTWTNRSANVFLAIFVNGSQGKVTLCGPHDDRGDLGSLENQENDNVQSCYRIFFEAMKCVTQCLIYHGSSLCRKLEATEVQAHCLFCNFLYRLSNRIHFQDFLHGRCQLLVCW